MTKYNDIEPGRWKDYPEIWTDSLWIIERRDNTGAHSSAYHGNFVPQIPRQLLLRYTKVGDWILDPFAGSGTTLIEAQRLGRNSIGLELQDKVALEATERVRSEAKDSVYSNIYVADSRIVNIYGILQQTKIQEVQFVILHPPYWDILKFSDNSADLSNSTSLPSFLENLGMVIDNVCSVLELNRYCAVVIGDKYANSEIVPLGFYCMELMRKRGYKHKATIIKNFEDTKGKAKQHMIWRYRALSNDFYIFKHEYIFVFKKI